MLTFGSRATTRALPRSLIVETSSSSVSVGRLQAAGMTAPIDPRRVYWIIVGAASIPFVNAPEVRHLTGDDPTDAAWVQGHAEGLVGMLLPVLAAPPTTT